MKLAICLTLLVSFSAWSRNTMDFSRVLTEDLKHDLVKDDDKFKKTSSRGPASVSPSIEPVIEETPKIDKNIRQIGPNKW